MCCKRLAGNTGLKNDAKNRHLSTIAQLCRAISSQLRHISIIGKKNLLSSNISSRCPYNMVNFGPLTAEIDWRVWGAPSYFNGYRVLAALLHGSQVVDVSQTLRRWKEGATYARQGDHHVGHWLTLSLKVVHSGCRNATRRHTFSVNTLSLFNVSDHCVARYHIRREWILSPCVHAL